LCKRLERRQIQKLRAAEPLNAGAATQLPVVGPLIVAADIADDIRIDLRQGGVDADGDVLDASKQALSLVLVQSVINSTVLFREVVASGESDTDLVRVDCTVIVGIAPPFCWYTSA
jgi:hypothetical protein